MSLGLCVGCVCMYVECIVCIPLSIGTSHIPQVIPSHSNHVLNVFMCRVTFIFELRQVLFQVHTLKELGYTVLQVE